MSRQVATKVDTLVFSFTKSSVNINHKYVKYVNKTLENAIKQYIVVIVKNVVIH